LKNQIPYILAKGALPNTTPREGGVGTPPPRTKSIKLIRIQHLFLIDEFGGVLGWAIFFFKLLLLLETVV